MNLYIWSQVSDPQRPKRARRRQKKNQTKMEGTEAAGGAPQPDPPKVSLLGPLSLPQSLYGPCNLHLPRNSNFAQISKIRPIVKMGPNLQILTHQADLGFCGS